MPEILKLPELPQNNRMTKMKIGAGGIDAELDPKRTAERQFRLADDLGGALLENGKSFVRFHRSASSLVAGCYLLLFNNSRTCSIVSGLS